MGKNTENPNLDGPKTLIFISTYPDGISNHFIAA